MRWPAQGWRPVDANSGDQGGVTEGLFEFAWLRRHPVRPQPCGGRQLPVRLEHLAGGRGRRARPAARAGADLARQLPSRRRPADLADARPELRRPARAARRRRDAGRASPASGATDRAASTSRPNVWHGAFVPHDDDATFLDRQGRVHARVSVDFPKEFGCYLAVPLGRPAAA